MAVCDLVCVTVSPSSTSSPCTLKLRAGMPLKERGCIWLCVCVKEREVQHAEGFLVTWTKIGLVWAYVYVRTTTAVVRALDVFMLSLFS